MARGGGPLHAASVARKLGIRRILVPDAAGVFSALGFLMATPSYEVARSMPGRIDAVDPAALARAFDRLGREAAGVVSAAAPGATLSHRRFAEMRYVGQGHQLRVAFDDDLSPETMGQAFARAYMAAYGYTCDDLVPEIVTLRVLVEAGQDSPGFAPGPARDPAPVPARPAWSAADGAMVDHAVRPFDALTGEIRGPALIGQPGTTILLPRGATARKAPGGWLDIALPDPATGEDA